MSKINDVLRALYDAGFHYEVYWDEESRTLVFPDEMDPYHDFCIEECSLEILGSSLIAIAKALKDDTPATSPPALS